MEHTKIRPFLKWAGGKFRLIDRILPCLPSGPCLIEPYVGAGSVFLNSQYKRYILGDTNVDLINLYNFVKQQPDAFIEEARPFFQKKYNRETQYYKLRDAFNQSNDQDERAILFLYLNRHGYNGLCRYNKKGLFNVPFGRYKQPYFPELEILAFAKKAQRARFICGDFRQVMRLARRGHVIYCDPPYVPLSQTAHFTQYHHCPFSLTDQETLAELANTLCQRGITTVISNHDTRFTRKLYRNAKISSFIQRRHISCHSQQRRHVKELIAQFIN